MENSYKQQQHNSSAMENYYNKQQHNSSALENYYFFLAVGNLIDNILESEFSISLVGFVGPCPPQGQVLSHSIQLLEVLLY
jgi:hypothetical protein